MSLEGGGIKRVRSVGGIQERKMKSRRRLNPKLDRGGAVTFGNFPATDLRLDQQRAIAFLAALFNKTLTGENPCF